MSDKPSSKVPWQSKTIWANFITAGSAFYPPAYEWIQSHGVAFSVGVMLLNVALRSISSKKIEWNWSLSD